MSPLESGTDWQLTDRLFLWWLADPRAPRLVGDLQLVRTLKGVSLRYCDAWLQHGFPLSEDLPLIAGERLPTEKETAAGAVDDARPDRWGERVIRQLDRPARLSLLEYLYFAGDERFGALGVSTSDQAYQPRRHGPLPRLADVRRLAELVQRVLDGEPVPEAERRLIVPGVSMGGARPKALLDMDGHAWVLKFGEPGEPIDMPLVEHATMTLAAQAGITVAITRAIVLPKGHAVAVRRFDRRGSQRLHALSAHVALRAAGEGLGYPELAQLLRRRGVAQAGQGRAQMAELLRRMVFNILIDNTDDHEKNHVLLMTDQGEYRLSPAFDILPSGQALGYQQMRVGLEQNDSTLTNALSEHAQFGLDRASAEDAVRQVAAVVHRWREHFAWAGVSNTQIEWIAQQIDRPYLMAQRRAWLD